MDDSTLWLYLPVLIWLAALSWFDLKTRQIPHVAWTLVPWITAAIYRAWSAEWQLALLSVLVIVLSERKRWSPRLQKMIRMVAWPAVVILILRSDSAAMVASLAIVVFWLAWELGVWGGADAMAAISLALLWPDIRLVISLVLGSLTALLVIGLVDLVSRRRIRRRYEVPGMPILAFSMVILFILSSGWK